MPIERFLCLCAFLLYSLVARGAGADQYLSKPIDWFRSPPARQFGSNILSWQSLNGDWPKNTDTVSAPRIEKEPLAKGTFDNGATTGELRFLAKLYAANPDEAFREAFLKGVRLVLSAQYPNGGWPQSYPPGKGYARYITYNDNTFLRLATFMHDLSTRDEFAFLPPPLREQANTAYRRAIDCILRTQVKVNGEPTVWCGQHDEITLEPRPARSFELVSLSGAESAGLLRFLMQVDHPGPDIRAAIDAGVSWFNKVALSGLRQVRQDGERRIIHDPSAPPLWARFYEIGANRPIFSGRDGIKRYSIDEIEAERRNGYAWYGDWGSALPKAYRAWQTRWPSEHP